MGRPLNKKYFGRRNIGSASTTADNGIGGQRIGSVTVSTAGAYTAAPTSVAFSRPLLEGIGGVRATGTLAFSPVAGQITVGGTQTQAYSSADVITQATTGVTFTPTLTTYAANSFAASAISANTITLSSAITAVKGTSITTDPGLTGVTGLTAGTTYYLAASVTASASITLSATPTGSALTISGTPGGTRTANIGTTTASVASVAYASGTVSIAGFNTTALATTASSSAGAGLTLTVVQWAVNSVTVTEQGSGYLGQNYKTVNITGVVSTGNKVTVDSTDELYPGAKIVITGTTISNLAAGTYHVLTIVDATNITVANSYANFITPSTFVVGTTASGSMTGVVSQHVIASVLGGTAVTPAVLTQVIALDTGAVGSVSNQENAIIMTAFLTGGSIGPVEVLKQVSTNRYKVTDGTRTGIVKLKASAVASAGEASIIATDASAGTYYVTKLTGHKATLTRGTGTVYVTGSATPWTFGTADATYCKITNA